MILNRLLIHFFFFWELDEMFILIFRGKPFPALGFGLCRVGENTLTKVVPVLVSLSQITLGSLKFSKGCGNEFIKITSMEELQSFSEKRYRFEQLLLASLGVGREENGRE